MEIQEKIKQIENTLKDKRVIIAFSGGSDSTLVAKIASKVSEDAIAVTVDTGTLPWDVIKKAKDVASKIGIQHEIVKENFLKHEKFKENSYSRCFFCKDRMYTLIESISKDKRFDIIVDGTNITDILEDRPGIIANYKRRVKSPLLEAKMTEDDVIEYLQRENIKYSKNTTCLATRIKGPITTKKLNRISYAENLIKECAGLELVRVRDFNKTAIIQVENTSKILDMNLLEYIEAKLKTAGFKRVYVDIGGYHRKRGKLIDSQNGGGAILELPYPIDLEKTCANFDEYTLDDILTVKIDSSIVKISEDGKIIFNNGKDVEDILLEVLPSIRRLEKLD